MYYIGIDLGGTNIAAAVVNERFEILGRGKYKTRCPRPAEEIADDMAAASRDALKEAGVDISEVKWVGVGTPGCANPVTGEIEFANNLQFHHVQMGQMITQRLGRPCYVENDANAAAYGELLAGAGVGCKDMIAVTLGTGVGGGIIIDGKVYHGYNFYGAELGHVVIVFDGEPCTCGRRGCWEAYASATALIRQTKAAMEAHPDSVMWEKAETLDKVSGRTAFDAMRAGDAAGKAVVNRYIEYVACGLIDLVNSFQPEIICMGGGICNEGETLMAPLRKLIERDRYSRYAEKQTKLVTAKLGNDAGLIGAAMLGRLIG